MRIRNIDPFVVIVIALIVEAIVVTVLWIGWNSITSEEKAIDDMIVSVDESEELPIPPAETVVEFADISSKIGNWVEAKCERGTQPTNLPVKRRSDSAWFVSTSARFDDEGRTQLVYVSAENSEILVIYLVTNVPGAAVGKPNKGSEPWAFWRYTPEYPSSYVYLESGRGFTAGDQLLVCTKPR